MDILVVSGNAGVLDGVASAFAGDDARLVEVRTPRAALDLLDRGDPCTVVVADGDTTPMGGYALARDIKAREQMGRSMPPVVILVARAQDKWLAQWAGADIIALKPVDPFDLREAVVGFLRDGEVPALPDIVQGGGPMRADAQQIERSGAESAAGGLTGSGP